MSFKTKESLYTSGEIKREAKAQISDHWMKVILLAIIPVLFSLFFISEVDAELAQMSTGRRLVNLFLQLIHTLILTSVSFTLLDFLRTDQEIRPLEGAFQAFKREYFGKLLLLKVQKYFYTILWTFLFIIPGIVKSYSYSQAELIFKDTVDRTGEVPNPGDCIDQSKKMMQGHKMDLFSLGLSFIGWYFLSIFTLGLLFIWLTPYIEMSQVVFYENLLVKQGLPSEEKKAEPLAGVGQDPDDFRDFDDF